MDFEDDSLRDALIDALPKDIGDLENIKKIYEMFETFRKTYNIKDVFGLEDFSVYPLKEDLDKKSTIDILKEY